MLAIRDVMRLVPCDVTSASRMPHSSPPSCTSKDLRCTIAFMSIVSVADARNHLSDVIERSQHEAVFIERRGRRAAVVISTEQYERMLEALEDAEDIAAFDEAMAEEGPSIPWAQVKADLGWK